MSGPKLMGITCDEEVIRRNRERLQLIGKYEYFKDCFEGINTDVKNTVKWIQDYGTTVLDENGASWFESTDSIAVIEEIKNGYIQRLLNRILEYSIIESHTEDELSKFVCDLIRDIPKEKEQFIEEVSELIDKIQLLHSQNDGISREELLKRRNKEIEEGRKKLKEASQYDNYETVDMIALNTIQDIVTQQKKELSIAEKMFVENVFSEITKYKSDMTSFNQESYLIKEIEKYLEYLYFNEDKYTYEVKCNAIKNLKLLYQALNKNISNSLVTSNSTLRKKRLYEYEMLSQALNIKMCSPDISDEELAIQLEVLTKEALKQEERIYIEDTISNIMGNHGYSNISSVNLHEYENTSNIIYEDKDDKKISVSFGDGMLMIQVVGEGEEDPTEEEIEKQLEQQGALCTLYPEIKRELQSHNINIIVENCAPISRDSCKNIQINRSEEGKAKMRRHSLLSRTFNSDTYANSNSGQTSNSSKKMSMNDNY